MAKEQKPATPAAAVPNHVRYAVQHWRWMVEHDVLQASSLVDAGKVREHCDVVGRHAAAELEQLMRKPEFEALPKGAEERVVGTIVAPASRAVDPPHDADTRRKRVAAWEQSADGRAFLGL
jgi:hypothetical protein